MPMITQITLVFIWNIEAWRWIQGGVFHLFFRVLWGMLWCATSGAMLDFWFCAAIVEILVMEEILHQLRLVVYPIIYKEFYIPGGDRRISEPSTVVLGLGCAHRLAIFIHFPSRLLLYCFGVPGKLHICPKHFSCFSGSWKCFTIAPR